MTTLRFSPSSPVSCERPGRVSAMIMLRLALALLISFVLAVAALAADRPALKGDVVVRADSLTLGDLVEGISAEAAATPLFRAPALGQTGTIQARRILEAARPLGLSGIETGGRLQVVVTRDARRIGGADIEAAVKSALQAQHGVDGRALSVNFDGPAPAMIVAPEAQGQLTVEDLTYDRRSRRVSALVGISAGSSERKTVRVTGVAVEYLEVAVLTRSLNRGETAQASDFVVERRARDGLPADAQPEAQTLAGRVARRALQVGAVVRTGDLARPEIVTRGEVVTIVYEVPGMILTMRGRASDAGAQGDTIAVVNPQSKKTLQAQVVGPGKVSVSAALPGRVAMNTVPAQP